MSKGIKMDSAKKKDYGNTVFHISKLRKSDNGKLICKSCGTDIQYVSAYSRSASNTHVAAYLKLWQEGEHSNECEYSLKGAVAKLVAESCSVEDTNPIFELQKDGTYLFRMNILVDEQKVAQKISESSGDFDSSEHLSTRRSYIHTEQQLASYFRSASGIAKVRALILDSADVNELSKLVKIQYKDSFISWSDFYYDESRYEILFNRLVKGTVFHPVAVNLTIKGEVRFYNNAKKFPWSFQCYSQSRKENNIKVVYMPWLQLAKRSFSESISAGDILLVVGDAWPNKVKDKSSYYRNFNISVYNKAQFKKEVE